ncbi:MAG: TonB-dependent receptor [Steroidobacteraceae bacterium]
MSFVFRISAAAAALSCLSATQVLAADELEAKLESVVVTATRTAQPISEVIGSVTVITREQIEQRQAQSLQDLLRGELGIDITNSGGAGKLSSLFLRGANSSQTLILVDGIRLGSATAGITSFELIPIEQIERIEIVRGPRSSLYGSDAMGGVIQIFTRSSDGFNASIGTGSYSTQNYSTGFGMQGEALRFSVNGNYTQTEGFDSCKGTFSGGCYTIEPDKDGYRNSSASARLGYAFGKLADLELSTLYAQGYTEFDGDSVNESRFRNSAPSLKLHLIPTDSLSITLLGGITQDKSDNFKDGIFKSRFNTEKRNAGAQIDWRLGQQQFSIGADYLNDIVDSDTDFTSTERDNTGVFVQYLGKLGTHELSASARRDDNQQFGNHNTGNAGWKWFVMERALAINAGWGKAFHAPSFNDLYYPADAFSAGNPNLKPERSQSYELGVSGNLSWLSWSLQGFSTRISDLIDWIPDASFFYSPNNVSAARLQGAELSLNGQWDKLTAGLNYTAQDPRSRETGVNHDHLLARRARQSGRIDLGYDFGAAQIGSSINVTGKRFDDLANTQVMGGYTTVDFKASVDLSKDFALQVKLGNFFDRQYETARYYSQEGRSIYLTLRYQPK